MKKKIETIKKIVMTLEKNQVNIKTVNMDAVAKFVRENENVKVLLSNDKTIMRLQGNDMSTHDINLSNKAENPYKVHVGEKGMRIPEGLTELFGHLARKATLEQTPTEKVIEKPEVDTDPFNNIEEFNIDEIKQFCNQFNNKVVRAINRGNIFVVIFDNETEFHFNLDGTISIVK